MGRTNLRWSFIAFVLTMLGTTGVHAQQPSLLPWTVHPGGTSDTSELNLRGQETLKSTSCIKLDFTVNAGGLPPVLEPYVQQGGNRYAYELVNSSLLPGAVAGTLYVLRIQLNEFSLKDPKGGALVGPLFQSAGSISDLGVEVWDNLHQTDLTISDLEIVDCAADSTGPQWCMVYAAQPLQIGNVQQIQFTAPNVDLSKDSIVLLTTNNQPMIVTGEWSTTVMNRFRIITATTLPMNWLIAKDWSVMISC